MRKFVGGGVVHVEENVCKFKVIDAMTLFVAHLGFLTGKCRCTLLLAPPYSGILATKHGRRIFWKAQLQIAYGRTRLTCSSVKCRYPYQVLEPYGYDRLV